MRVWKTNILGYIDYSYRIQKIEDYRTTIVKGQTLLIKISLKTHILQFHHKMYNTASVQFDNTSVGAINRKQPSSVEGFQKVIFQM